MTIADNGSSFTPSMFQDLSAMAYVRPVMTEEGAGFAVCSTDGTQLAVFPTKEAAYYAAKQHELEPLLIH